MAGGGVADRKHMEKCELIVKEQSVHQILPRNLRVHCCSICQININLNKKNTIIKHYSL